MRIFFLMFAASLPFSAFADDRIETDIEAELTLVGAFMNDDDSAIDARNGLGEVSISTSASRVMDNGVEISGRLTWRGQIDHPNRPGFAGAIVDCPASDVMCPQDGGTGIRGGFSRLSTYSFSDDVGARGSLEHAYIEVDGGWGTLTIGRDDGVAARFYEGGPTVFTLARDHDPILDPTGINGTRVRNDISSTAEKVSYTSPRILGVRAGISYTPDASVRRLDLDTSLRAPGVTEPELDDAIEVGLQASRLIRSSDLRVRGSLTWSEASSANPLYDDVQTLSAGVDVERRDVFRLGVSGLTSDNGGLGEYNAIAMGGAVYLGDWEVGLNGSRASDDALGADFSTTTVGISRDINAITGVTVGYRHSQADFNYVPPWSQNDQSQHGVLLELRIRK